MRPIRDTVSVIWRDLVDPVTLIHGPNTTSPVRDLLQQTMLVLIGDKENKLLYCLIVLADNDVAITMTTNNKFTLYNIIDYS